MSDLDNDRGRQAIRERLSRGERPETIAFENSLGWADEAVVRDEARKRAAWQSGSSSRSSSASEASGNGAFAGIVMLIGLAIFAISSVYTWLADNPVVVYGLGAAAVLIPTAILVARFFQHDRENWNTGQRSSPFSRWLALRKKHPTWAPKFQELIRNEIDDTEGTVDQVLRFCEKQDMRAVYRAFEGLDNGAEWTPQSRKNALIRTRSRLLEDPSFKDRPDLIFLFCLAHVVARTYHRKKDWEEADVLRAMKEAIIGETRERGGPRLARDIKRILKHL